MNTKQLHDTALLATFYGERGQLTPLRDYLVHTRQLIAEDTTTFVNNASDTLLVCFDPPAAPDTSIIQVALNHTDAPPTAWSALRTQLDLLLDDTRLQWPIWGYSLVYQAMLPDNRMTTEAYEAAWQPLLQDLLPSVQRLHPPPGEWYPPLAHSSLSGGLLSLHTIPREHDGIQAAIIYVALSYPNTNNQLVRQALLGPGGGLLMPDLIAHKSYHQIRQYASGDWLDTYNHLVDTVHEHTQFLLTTAVDAATHTNKSAVLRAADLHVAGYLSQLHALQLSLEQQEENYSYWMDQLPEASAVCTFHLHHLQVARRELALLDKKGNQTHNSAQIALAACQQQAVHIPPQHSPVTATSVMNTEPIQLTLHFTLQEHHTQIIWTSDVMPHKISSFTPPYQGADLELVIRALDAVQYPNHPYHGPTFTPDERTRLADLGLWRDKCVSRHASETVGYTLYTALISDQNGRDALQTVRDLAYGEERSIHYILRFPYNAVELAALPWEALHDQHQAILFSRGAREVDSCERYLDLDRALPPSVSLPPTLRILALSPYADIDPTIRQAEREARLKIWEDLKAKGLVEWEELAPVTVTSLDNWLRRNQRPDIVHFYGHGSYHQGQGHLLFDGPDPASAGRSVWVRADQLAATLGGVRLLMLYACQSSMSTTTTSAGGILTGVAPALSIVSDIVVAMQLTMQVQAATRFSSIFYEEVAQGRSVQAAVATARRSLYVDQKNVNWYVPTLYRRTRERAPMSVIPKS